MVRALLIAAVLTIPFTVWSASVCAQSQDAPVSLRPGETTTGVIGGGSVKHFKISLAQGSHVRIMIQQQRIILSATLKDSQQNQIIQTDSPAGGIGPIYISVIAPTAGDYLLDIESTERWSNPGKYEILVQEVGSSEITTEQIAAEKSFAEGRRQFKLGTRESRQAAIVNYKRALDYWSAHAEPHWLAFTLYSLAATYRRLGEQPTAAELLDRALAVNTSPEDWRIKASCFNDRGLNYQDLKKFPLAFESSLEALRLFRANDDRRGQASALGNLGLGYHKTGQFDEARKYYEEALPLRRAESDKAGEANLLNNIGGIHDVMGEPQIALGLYQGALTVLLDLDSRNELTNYDQLATTFNNVAETYDKLGEPQQALDGYEQALKIIRKTGNKTQEAIFLDNLGELQNFLGDLDGAITNLKNAVQILEGKDPGAQANVIVHLAETYFAKKQFTEARQLFQKAKSLRPDARGQAIALARIASVSAALGDNAEASDLYSQALKLSTEASDPRTQAWVLHKQGELHGNMGQHSLALAELEQALTKWRAVKDPRGEAATLNRMAAVSYALNDFDKAANYSGDAIRIVESTRGRVTSKALRSAYFALNQNYYDIDIQIHMKLYRATGSTEHLASAFATSEKARARNLLDTLYEAEADLATGVDEKLLAQKQDVRHRLNAKANRLLALSTVANREKEQAKLENDVAALVAESNAIETKIRARNSKYATLTTYEPLGLADVQKLLDNQTVLLEFFLGDVHSYAWAITSSGINGFELPSRSLIEPLARKFYQSISSDPLAANSTTQVSPHPYAQIGSQLGDLVLKPVSSFIKGKRVVVVADGILQYIPFATLNVADASRSIATLNSDVPEFVYLPSAAVLRIQRRDQAKRQTPPNVLAVLADPVYDTTDIRVAEARTPKRDSIALVPGQGSQPALNRSRSKPRDYDSSLPEGVSLSRLLFSKQEADSIVAAVSSRKVLEAVGFDANLKTATNAQLSQYRIVHFATHAVINETRPQLSALVLSRVDTTGKPQDGLLLLHDVYDLRLNADIVVLSACQTGLGKDIKGEGLVSLTRGFMHAGASRVVASLWKVDDSATASLMAEFYKQMFTNKKRPAAALREAQIFISKQNRWRHPYFWAGFVLQGEWR